MHKHLMLGSPGACWGNTGEAWDLPSACFRAVPGSSAPSVCYSPHLPESKSAEPELLGCLTQPLPCSTEELKVLSTKQLRSWVEWQVLTCEMRTSNQPLCSTAWNKTSDPMPEHWACQEHAATKKGDKPCRMGPTATTTLPPSPIINHRNKRLLSQHQPSCDSPVLQLKAQWCQPGGRTAKKKQAQVGARQGLQPQFHFPAALTLRLCNSSWRASHLKGEQDPKCSFGKDGGTVWHSWPP